MPTIKGIKTGDEGEVQLGKDSIVRRYELEFIVIADNATQGVIDILNTIGLPIVGLSVYNFHGTYDTLAVCRSKKGKRHPKQPLVWMVTCSFDSDPQSESSENESDENTERPPIESWEVEYGTEVMTEDFDDPPKLVLNSVGEPFDPPLTRRIVFPVLVIERIENGFAGAPTILQYCEKTNEESFRGAPPGSVMMASITSKDTYEKGARKQAVTYRLRFSPQGYDAHVLNQGTRYRLEAESNQFRSFLTIDKVPYIGNLNADGTKADEGDSSFCDFRAAERTSFTPLGL